jgi:hypothetical protein
MEELYNTPAGVQSRRTFIKKFPRNGEGDYHNDLRLKAQNLTLYVR